MYNTSYMPVKLYVHEIIDGLNIISYTYETIHAII